MCKTISLSFVEKRLLSSQAACFGLLMHLGVIMAKWLRSLLQIPWLVILDELQAPGDFLWIIR